MVEKPIAIPLTSLDVNTINLKDTKIRDETECRSRDNLILSPHTEFCHPNSGTREIWREAGRAGSRDFMVTCLISMELTAALVLFLTVLSLLVGGNWTSIYRKMDMNNDESRQTSLGDWVMRNNIQPSLQILGMILFQHVTCNIWL